MHNSHNTHLLCRLVCVYTCFVMQYFVQFGRGMIESIGETSRSVRQVGSDFQVNSTAP